MLSVVYRGKGDFALLDKPLPRLLDEKDAIVRVTLSSICQSDIHIKHGSVPRAVPGTTVGHEFVGVVEEVGPGVKKLKPGMRVAANVETFCGECFFCKRGFVNNCTDKNGGWALGEGDETVIVEHDVGSMACLEGFKARHPFLKERVPPKNVKKKEVKSAHHSHSRYRRYHSLCRGSVPSSSFRAAFTYPAMARFCSSPSTWSEKAASSARAWASSFAEAPWRTSRSSSPYP